MRIILAIMANILVVVVSVIAVQEYHLLKNYASFTVPFTHKMVSLGVVDAARQDSLLREDRISHYVGMLLCAVVWLMLARFIAGLSAIFVFVAAVTVQLLFLKPELGETPSTRRRYFSAHKKDMDQLKYHEYLEKVEDASLS
ncbi:MAG: hypothetical protein ACOYI7_09650 [Candidatus Excrementavichristensenella sp.]|jgi:hypothetical protein